MPVVVCAHTLCVSVLLFFFHSGTTSSKGIERRRHLPERTAIAYKSAFRSLEAVPQDKVVSSPEKTCYTIQICSLTVLMDDPFLNGQYKIKAVRMGELYRYIFSSYTTLESARKELSEVRKIFPKAFIREYDGNKLGKAIDLDI